MIPTLSSVASMFLFAHVAGRVTRGPARLLAVAIFAVSYYPIRHGAEVKQYSTDLLAALVLLALAIEWRSRPGQDRWLWALVAAVPLALGLSHPAVFVAGGISLGLARMVWNARRAGALFPFALYNLAMVGAFVGLFIVFTGEQERLLLPTLRSHYWAEAFPPLREPVKLFVWLAEAHTGRMFAYPFGDARGGSSLHDTLFCGGARFALAAGREDAAGAGARPVRARVRGVGDGTLSLRRKCPHDDLPGTGDLPSERPGSGRDDRQAPPRPGPQRAFLCVRARLGREWNCLTWGQGGLSVQEHPDQNSREFARSFWNEQARDSELVCVKSDLGWVSTAATGRFSGPPFICAIKRSIRHVTVRASG